MRLVAFPRGRTRRRDRPGESVRSVESARGWTLDVRGRRARRYTLEVSLATLKRPFSPCALRLRGRRLPRSRWRYAKRERVLRLNIRVRTGRLTARRRCAT